MILSNNILENDLNGKNIYIFVCNVGNMRNTWKDYESILNKESIKSKIDFVYPIKNGIDDARIRAINWAEMCINKKD